METLLRSLRRAGQAEASVWQINAFLIEMAVVIVKVHWKNGLTGQGGYEFPLALATIAFALMCYGGGPFGFNFGKGGGGWRKG